MEPRIEPGRSRKNPTTGDQEDEERSDREHKKRERREDTINRDEKSGKMTERNMDRAETSFRNIPNRTMPERNAFGEPVATLRRNHL